MNKNQNTKEKICAFYASDYHFEMISLPYIDKKMENKDEIIILPENNLETTMETFLSKTNLKEEKKTQILNLEWDNNNERKLKKLQNKKPCEKDMIVFIKGKEKYIKEIHEKIDKYLPQENHIKIIDCYDMEEIGENLDKVMEQYPKILKTTGEQGIEKI